MADPKTPAPVIDFRGARRLLQVAGQKLDLALDNARVGIDTTGQRAAIATMLRNAAKLIEPERSL